MSSCFWSDIRLVDTPAFPAHVPTAGQSLIEAGESLKQLADIKYALEDNVKQNFLEPLTQLQTKDLKDVLVGSSASQSINQPSYQSINQLTIKSIDYSINN